MNFFEDYVETISLPPFQDNNQNLFRNYASRIFNLNNWKRVAPKILSPIPGYRLSKQTQAPINRRPNRIQLPAPEESRGPGSADVARRLPSNR